MAKLQSGGHRPPYRIPLAPAQVVVLERDGAEPLTGDLEYRVENCWRDLRDSFLACARDPAVRLHERDVDLLRILVHARYREFVEVAFDGAAVLERGRLIHGVVVSPGDLSFD